ncbi:hypothetical protein [Siphonobacter sp. SORGH_AS_1065]|uniref:hypothetical protein n=1 Tax=Siphonobacter sp. SORGH_AS_1065 TaxID=3041795 RepID=UPI0027805876|nr:hypothetical protein [Siphonobacter sp. SORGH_AS_1065]MDQ1089342.1 hypothetical protein [Siphonobacter sp. SORGH_AS_1065]
MKVFIISTLVTLGLVTSSLESKAQEINTSPQRKYAVGFKVGEPLGLNARIYTRNNRGLDLSFGTYGMLWGSNRKYGPHGRFKNTGWALSANYIFHTDNEGKNFQAYYGFGGQITSRRSYPERLAPYNAYENRTGIGASGLAGVEYFLPQSPLSIFVDAGLYLEVIPVPAFIHVQAGIGTRFNF